MDNQQETKLQYIIYYVKVGSSETTRKAPLVYLNKLLKIQG